MLSYLRVHPESITSMTKDYTPHTADYMTSCAITVPPFSALTNCTSVSHGLSAGSTKVSAKALCHRTGFRRAISCVD